MKKLITLVFTTLSAIIILDSFNAWHAIAMFYLAGEIPGTRTSINAETMLSIFALLIGFVLARISSKIALSIAGYISTKQSILRA